MANLFQTNKQGSEENWISVSDLMAGLMMVFLFIAVIYAKDANHRAQNVTEIVTEWQDTELEIYSALNNEFEEDLKNWNAEIDKETLTIRFVAPEVLFKSGSAELEEQFKTILDDFMPRYISLLGEHFLPQISEIRIEGHTSSEWNSSADLTEAFVHNMELSQERTRAVLSYSLGIHSLESYRPWMRNTVSANGLSSARTILVNGAEDKQKSRRVEFTIRTKTKEALFRILERVAPAIERRL
ncbi:OmpA family protein [Curvivirga sp.]|uniref:OmpA family protein n=1 Tax=Curvivirga sp. TaxID=2856848 RepID=UPI003B5A24DA